MKYLLYSKRFRKKLSKWLVMYCFIICLFTLVVTYSRYITNNVSDDTARVAKFNIEFKFDKACIGETDICNLGVTRPQKEIDYYFSVDTTEVEVNTDLIMTMKVNTDFDNYKLYDVDNNKLLEQGIDYEVNNNIITLRRDITEYTRGIKHYKLNVEYKNVNNYAQEYSYASAVHIGYKAVQK